MQPKSRRLAETTEKLKEKEKEEKDKKKDKDKDLGKLRQLLNDILVSIFIDLGLTHPPKPFGWEK